MSFHFFGAKRNVLLYVLLSAFLFTTLLALPSKEVSVGSSLRDTPVMEENYDTLRKEKEVTPHSLFPFSISHACGGEIRSRCGDSQRRISCFLTQMARLPIEADSSLSMSCKVYLMGRESCVTAVRVELHDRVEEWCKGSSTDVRECLRRVPPYLLPTECLRSSYYRSVLLVSKSGSAKEFLESQ